MPAPETSGNGPVISVTGLAKSYPGNPHPAVNDLTFEVLEGETLAILGPSGCGKTTTLRLLAGFEVPDAGEVRIRDVTVASRARWTPPEKRGVGMVFQQFALFPHLTVRENAVYGLSGLRRGEKERRAAEVLELVGMAAYDQRYPHGLSGGQQQRVALARALAPGPAVLLMDEPFGSLDSGLRSQMRREVKSILARSGATSIIVTHDQDEAFGLSDRVLVLHEGRVEQIDTPDIVYHQPRTRFVGDFVGLADYLPATYEGGKIVTEVGVFPYSGDSFDGEMDLLLRPDDVDIDDDGAGGGEVMDREFRRAYNRYTVQLASGRTIRSFQSTLSVYAMGQRVRIRAHPDHIVLFPHQRRQD